MNSPRDWGDDPEVYSQFGDAERAFGKRLAIGLLLIILLITVAIVAIKVLGSPEPLLVQARELIANVQATGQRQPGDASVKDAEMLLIRYVQSGGRNRSTADLLRSVTLLIQRKHTEVQQIASTVSLRKCDHRDLLIAGKQFLHSSHASLAYAIVDALLAREERDAEVLRLAVKCRFQQGRMTEALRLATDLVKREPEDAETWLTIALIHESRSSWQDIVEPLRKHIKFSTGDTSAQRLQLVRYLVKNGQTDEARQEFDQLAIDAPDAIKGNRLVEAILLHAENKPLESLSILQSGSFAGEADRIEALSLGGKILLSQTRPEEAAEAFNEALSIDPADHESHYLLGQAYARLGKNEQAQQHFARQLELIDLKKQLFQLQMQAERAPTDVSIRLEIAEMYGRIGWPEMQQEWLELAEAARNR